MALFNLKKVKVQTYSIQFVGYSMHLTRGNGGRHFGAGQVHVSHLFSFSFEFFLTRKVVILHDGVCIVQLASWDGLPLPLRQFYLSFNIVFSIFRFVVTHVASRWRWRRRGSIDGVTGVAVTASRLPPPPPLPPSHPFMCLCLPRGGQVPAAPSLEPIVNYAAIKSKRTPSSSIDNFNHFHQSTG